MTRSTGVVIALISSSGIAAQDCGVIDHVTRQFDVRVENAVFYGTASRFDGGTDSLRMNIFKPVGDDATERPLLVMIHGGAFIGGDRSEMNQLCQWYAERGYVAATVSYRLGFYPPIIVTTPFAYDQAEVIRAAYRAQQDVKGAIRALRARHALDSTSTANVFVYGISAGGITAMHTSFATEAAEKPANCGALGAVDHVFNQYARPDLGPIAGPLNLDLGFDASVKACVSHFGAILETGMITSTADPALFTYHQTGDPVVGCGYQQALWGMPLGMGANYPWLFGSCAIDPHMQQLGYTAQRYEFHPYAGSAHDIHDIALVDGWAAEFLARQFCDVTTATSEGRGDIDQLVFPNPASERITVRWDGEHLPQLRLNDLRGRSLSRTSGTALDVSGLDSGTYLLTIQAGDLVRVERVVIAR